MPAVLCSPLLVEFSKLPSYIFKHTQKFTRRMVSLLEIFLSAILGDLASRSVDFFANRLPKTPAPQDVEDRLRSVLLRAQVIIDEAMGRWHITNQAMLRQLDALIGAVHRGYYALDTSRCQDTSCHHQEESSTTMSLAVSRCRPVASVFSRVGSVKDLCFPRAATGGEISEEMQEVLDRLSAMIADAHELVLFLANSNYGRRVDRQPYSMYLLLGNCMFGRRMETQLVIDFLLHAQHPSAEEPAVLPIVGSFRVGKSTLVAHICKDERVRGHFSETVFLSDHDFAYDGLAAFREGLCGQQDHGTSGYCSSKDGMARRMLLVVKVGADLDEDAWNRLYTATKHWMPRGSKIILTSRSDKIAKLGTTQALTLKPLSHEAYWYFFRTLAFGSADPMSHPRRLTSLAMEIATMLKGSMIITNVSARMLRDNFSVQFWGKFAEFIRSQFQRHVSKFGEHPYDLLNQYKPVYFGRIHRRSEQVVAYHQYYRHSSQQDHQVPKITLHDVTYGDAKLPRRFEALAWTSPMPPYYSYIYACEIQEQKSSTGNKRKRSVENGATFPVNCDC